jgi:putative spermidine/putrescine transport system ATP-binding protein
MSASPELELRGITKRFGDTVAVSGISLNVAPGEFVSLLGPSGCGKTTTLRMIAGFLLPDEGRVILRGRDITDAPAYRRDVGLLFQNYALFPHMTVRGNVGFGPRMRRQSRRKIAERVRWALDLVQLSGFEDRRSNELSGGQQQRVAIARVLAAGASVLLLDEPFSNLDARLRGRMQEEVRELQLRLGMAAVHVTHDQDEAMAMSDRIVIMNAGRVEQIGTPQVVYGTPESVFVAEFMGRCNRVTGTLSYAKAAGWTLELGKAGQIALEHSAGVERLGKPYEVFIRPEHVQLAPAGSIPSREGVLQGEVQRLVYLGSRSAAYVMLAENIPLLVYVANAPGPEGQWLPSGRVDVVPLPGSVMPLPT